MLNDVEMYVWLLGELFIELYDGYIIVMAVGSLHCTA